MAAYGVGGIVGRLVGTSVFFPSLCNIKRGPGTQGASGQPAKTPLTNVMGLTNLKCRVAPLIKDRPSPSEDRQQGFTPNKIDFHVDLAGYYTGINTNMFAEVDGVVYEIGGIEADGNHEYTRLRVMRVRP